MCSPTLPNVARPLRRFGGSGFPECFLYLPCFTEYIFYCILLFASLSRLMAAVLFRFGCSHAVPVPARLLLLLRGQVGLRGTDSSSSVLLPIYFLLSHFPSKDLKCNEHRASTIFLKYRADKNSWYVVARNSFLLLLNFSAWPCLGPA